MAFATLTVHINQIKDNLKQIRKTLPSNTRILLVAKANAYGLGAIPICLGIRNDIDYIGVATTTEALELRQSGIKTPILLLSEPIISDLEHISKHDITVSVYQKSSIKKIEAFSIKNNSSIKTHLKIDTGMNRLGISWQESSPLIDFWLQTSPLIIKEGIYSHFANSDSKNNPLNASQLSRFNTAISPHSILIKHCANSDATTTIKNCTHDLVRIGLKAYNHAFILKASIRYIQYVQKGSSIGYGSAYISDEDCQIAIIGMGYADGIPSHLSNKGHVVINKFHCPIVGKICMDMFMAKLPKNSSNISIGDSTTIISNGDDGALTITEMATLSGSNPREIMTRLSQRVVREYKDSQFVI